MRPALVMIWCGCGPLAHEQPLKPPVPERQLADGGAVAPNARSVFQEAGSITSCVIKAKDVVIVLDIDPVSSHTLATADLVTARFRAEVTSSSLMLSSYQRSPMYEQWDAACSATPVDDGECMAAVARRLRTDWLLWGELERSGGHFRVSVQLVPSRSPKDRRSLTFQFTSHDEIPLATHNAWEQLVREDP